MTTAPAAAVPRHADDSEASDFSEASETLTEEFTSPHQIENPPRPSDESSEDDRQRAGSSSQEENNGTRSSFSRRSTGKAPKGHSGTFHAADFADSPKRKKKTSTWRRGDKLSKEAVKQSLSLPEQLNLATESRPRKRNILSKLLGHKKSDDDNVTRNSTQTAQRATLLHGVINNLSIRPPVKEPSRGGEESESRLFMSDVLENFKRQKVARLTKTTSTLHKEMIQQALDTVQNDFGAVDQPRVRRRLMDQLRLDRWWSEARYCGQAYTSGVMFQQHLEEISEHLVLLEQKHLLTHKETIRYVQKLTREEDSSALENISPLSNFSRSQEVTAVDVGYSFTALVSRLGKVFIQAPVREYASCLGVPDCPADWNGTLYLDTILGRRIASVSCGPSHFGAITDTNEVILWGVNSNYATGQISGQLGNKALRCCTPVMVTGLPGTPKRIACGAAHTVILTTTGVFTCGSNDHGQLGYESRSTVHPTLVNIIDKFNVHCTVSTIACGAFHTLVSTEEGLIFAWGLNRDGQLGLPPTKEVIFSRPICVGSLSSIVTVAAGESHSMALNDSGQVFTWGSNLFGQLGHGPAKEQDWEPRMVSLGINAVTTFVVQISAGPFCSMALTNWGTGFTWGMLQSPLNIKHQFKPRLLSIPFQQNLFLVHLAPGLTHAVFMEDAELSRTLAFLQKVSRFEIPVDNKILTEQLQRIPAPQQTFGLLQERVAFNLRQNFTDPVPCISVSHSYITFTLTSLSRVNSTTVRVRNPNDTRLLVRPVIPFNESKFQIFVKPESFVMNKRSSKEFTIQLVSSRPLEEPIYRIIHLVTKKISKNEVADAHSLTQADSQYIIACSLIPAVETQSKKDEPTDHVLQLIRSLSTYVPRVLKEYFMLHPNAPHEPKIQQFPAAILFLDISGFTTLNERLAELGSAGAEIVSKHINSYFTQLIEAVSAHGGDVLKFAGDALICMWKGDEELEILTLRAVQCGLDIQTKLAKYDSNEGFSLTLHIGVGSGELFSLWVGSVDGSWEYLVSGEPLVQLRTAVDNSQSGQVVISQPSWELIKHRCVGEPIGDDFWVKEIEDQIAKASLPPLAHWPRADAEPALRSFIPLAVQVSVDSQHLAGWQNELRTATVLFVKLNTPIPDHDKQEYLLTIHSVLACMQRSIFKYDGMVRQFLADDKGTVLIAAFGLPPLSHIDDPIRGIKAALEIHQELALLNMDCSIGVTTGKVFCGSVGSQVRQEYAMVGDTVNLSARLMVAAYKLEFNILCDQATYENAHNALHLDKLPAINVKGKKHLVNIYHPTSGPKHSVFEIPRRFDPELRLTNRPTVLKKITDLVTRLSDPRVEEKGTVMIDGEQGMGKSVVVHELVAQTVQHKILVCHAIADGVQSTSEFYTFRTILADLLRITNIHEPFKIENFDNSSLIEQFTKLLDRTWFEMIPLLNDLLPLNLAENSVTSAIAAAHRTDYLYSLLRIIFEKISATEQLMIVVEDAQWIDNYSRTLLKTIATQIPAICVVCSVRSYIGEDFVNVFADLPNLQTVHLEPLTQEESLRFVQSLLEVTTGLPAPLVEIMSKANGNPLLLSEITAGLKEAGAIRVEEGECKIAGELNSINLTRVTRLLISTLDRFSAVQQMILKVASVIGYHFDLPTLVEVFPAGGNQKKFLKGELDVLVRLQIIKVTSLMPGSEAYRFVNPSFLEVVYDRLTFAQRFELHAHLGEWYERRNEEAKTRLAYHWTEVVECMKDPSEDIILKSIKYLRLSGERALRSPVEAWNWFNKAYTMSSRLPPGEHSDEIRAEIQRYVDQIFPPDSPVARPDYDATGINMRNLAGISGSATTEFWSNGGW